MALLGVNPGVLNDLNRLSGQYSTTTRQQGIARPVQAGGTGDDDLQSFYGAPELSDHHLVQEAPNGLAGGYAVIGNGPIFLPNGTTHLANPASPYLVGNTYLTPCYSPPSSIPPEPGVCGGAGTPAAWDYKKVQYEGKMYWYSPSKNKVWDPTTNTFVDPPWPPGTY